MRRKLQSVVIGVAAAALANAAYAGEPTSAEMAAELKALKAEVAQLRKDQGDNWLNERRAEEVKSLIREVLSDADTRASLQGDGMTAGWNKGFFLASEDGKFLMQLGGRIQLRYIWNNRDGEGSSFDDNEAGFQLRRVKPYFKGHIGSPKIEYLVVLAGGRAAADVGLEEALMAYKFADTMKVYGGRTKAPFLREELTSSGKQLTAERSVTNEIFTVGFVEGVGIRHDDESFRANVMIHDGQNSGEIGGTSNEFDADATDFAISGRADLRLMGDFKQSEDFNAWSGEETGLFVGAAVHYELVETGNRSTTNDNDSFVMWTLDSSLESGGFNLYGAFIGRHFDDEDRDAGENNTDQYGAVIQLGYMVIPDKLEPFVRWEWFDLDESVQADENQLLTVGFNYYLKKHDAKFTVDMVWIYGDAMFDDFKGLGIMDDLVIADTDEANDQFVLRAQFQLQY